MEKGIYLTLYTLKTPVVCYCGAKRLDDCTMSVTFDSRYNNVAGMTGLGVSPSVHGGWALEAFMSGSGDRIDIDTGQHWYIANRNALRLEINNWLGVHGGVWKSSF